jgi:hypothetical protein
MGKARDARTIKREKEQRTEPVRGVQKRAFGRRRFTIVE